ncbi:MAG: dynamin family protein [Saprospiraceae bacterium]
MDHILNNDLQKYKTQIDQIVKELHDLTIDISHSELEKVVSDLRNRINEPFMFVIVGEVKVGKSSFVNALLGSGKEICKVSPAPMTDTIQQIIYGEKEETIMVSPFLKKITQPVEILKEIAIVDTPGTNTIVDQHQEITERFIPASDLIVFVFESKNPYRQSAWDFFNFIHDDWRKKIIFVLQQKDLMPEEDLQVNIKGVHDYAVKKGIVNPNIFAVSAKLELENNHEASGYLPLRDFIKENITGGKAPGLKLQNNIATSKNINERISSGVNDRKKQWESDVVFRKDITQTLDEQSVKSSTQVDQLVENLLSAYDRITYKKQTELSNGLSFFSLLRRQISSIFSKKENPQKWLNDLADSFDQELNSELKNKLNDGVVDIADSIQQMGKMIDLKIQNSQTILKNNHDIFSDIAERRSNVLIDLQKTFSSFMSKSENFTDQELFGDKENLVPNLAAGSGIAAVGIILSTFLSGMVADVTGGILTTVGLLFAGVSMGKKKRQVLGSFKEAIASGRLRLDNEVTEKLKTYIANIKGKIDANFHGFDELIETEEKQIEVLEQKHQSIETRLDELEKQVS